jgi:NAD-dependent dihydropyrimidine dehydrogenase PreA subunit
MNPWQSRTDEYFPRQANSLMNLPAPPPSLILMTRKAIFCHCGAKLLEPTRAAAISGYLQQAGHPFTEISDLCGTSVDRRSETRDLLLSADEILMIACFPRAVKLLLANCGIDPHSTNFIFVNFRAMSDSEIFAAIDSFFAGGGGGGESSVFQSHSEWPAWFPVIDYSRCSACGQCADFCLFGVYEKRDDKVVVVNPKECKNNCPACGRICPQTAIVFPKYEHAGAIAGAETIDEISEQQRQQIDIDTILGSNIYQALALRKAKRQSIIRTTAMQQAIAERDKALAGKSPKP